MYFFLLLDVTDAPAAPQRGLRSPLASDRARTALTPALTSRVTGLISASLQSSPPTSATRPSAGSTTAFRSTPDTAPSSVQSLASRRTTAGRQRSMSAPVCHSSRPSKRARTPRPKSPTLTLTEYAPLRARSGTSSWAAFRSRRRMWTTTRSSSFTALCTGRTSPPQIVSSATSAQFYVSRAHMVYRFGRESTLELNRTLLRLLLLQRMSRSPCGPRDMLTIR